MESDVLLPDGVGIVFASRFLKGNQIKKIAGADLHEFLLKKMDAEHGSCFYLGSSMPTLEKIEARLAKEYPNIRVGVYSPPFKPQFSEKENSKIRQAVNDFRPDVLFVGMTAPKQENWSYAQKDKLDAKIICSIGAVFDFYAGTVSRPGTFWQNMGLEWLGRLLREPRRMWRRYIYYGTVFGFYLCKEKVRSVIKKDNLSSAGS
jgi:N-acetylglucosaminyldiphosphoundecaprenol N-acetyl-beta-D-mannosaminyltransferase